MLNCQVTALFLVLGCLGGAAHAAEAKKNAAGQAATGAARKPPPKAVKKFPLDHSGKARKGKASYYGGKFKGKKMADGSPMNPNANAAASKTLPLGTTARVTNLESGKSAVVEIRDRGPYVPDRIVDVTPRVAEKLDMKEDGIADVEVKPIAVPQPDGTVKPGAGLPGSPGG
ncbi:MAG: septal ring lytic transglycosylase RlpA family protein, partial [Oxalobacteraceae bacterium]